MSASQSSADNIFSGLKVVDFASFLAAPGAAVMLSDFGADVIKVEPPVGDFWRIGYRIPPQPRSSENYPWHLNNRNKRGLVLDLKSPQATEVLERLVKWADVVIVNTPAPARVKLKLRFEDVTQWNPRLIYADITGFGEHGPDAELPGFDVTAYWARSGLLSLTRDAGAPPTLPVSGSGDHATSVSLYSAIVTALYRRERTGKGSCVTTSLLATGVWACSLSIQAALCDGSFFPLHDRLKPPNALWNVYRSSDDNWFLLAMTPDHFPALAKIIGRPELVTDDRFSDGARQAANSPALTSILDEAFSAQPMAHWRELFDIGHITYGAVRHPNEVVTDPQLLANEIVVPLAGAGEKMKTTVSSPFRFRDVTKVAAHRAPELGEHNDTVLAELGFTAGDIDKLHAGGAVPKTPKRGTP